MVGNPHAPPSLQFAESVSGDAQTKMTPNRMVKAPAQSKARPPKRPRHSAPPVQTGYSTKWQLPDKDEGIEPSEEPGDEELQQVGRPKSKFPKRLTEGRSARSSGAKRRKVWIQLGNGRKVEAHFWIP